MARRVQDLDDEFANAERLAVGEQAIEIAAIGPQVFGIEYGAEDPLHVLDVLADADPRAGPGFDVGRTGEMVGMRMGLEYPLDRKLVLVRRRQNGFYRTDVDGAVALIEIEDGIDHRRAAGHGIGHQIADGVGGLVEERPDDGCGCMGHWF